MPADGGREAGSGLGSPAGLLWVAAVGLIVWLIWQILATLVGPSAPAGGTRVDPARLAVHAAEIRPVITALDQARQGGIYPLAATDILAHLPPASGILADRLADTVSLDIGGGRVWIYARDPDGLGYQLFRPLPGGGRLTLAVRPDGRTWRYQPDEMEEEEELPADLPPGPP